MFRSMNIKSLTVAISALVLSTSVNAEIIQDIQYQTTDGQLFTHNLTGEISNGTGATLTTHLRGDFHSLGQYNENFSISIDGFSRWSEAGYGIFAGIYNITEHSINDVEFFVDTNLEASMFSSLMSDSVAIVTVDFGAGVDNFAELSFSEVTLSYNNQVSNVPVPAAVWLFGSGLLGLVGVARRKKA